jgi:hypothetical protein
MKFADNLEMLDGISTHDLLKFRDWLDNVSDCIRGEAYVLKRLSSEHSVTTLEMEISDKLTYAEACRWLRGRVMKAADKGAEPSKSAAPKKARKQKQPSGVPLITPTGNLVV